MKRPESELDLFGIRAPQRFTDSLKEYEAIRDGAALLPSPWETPWVVRGRDRKGFLHALLTADIAALREGECRPAAQTDRKGHLLVDLWILDAGERLFVRMRADRQEAIREFWRKHRISEDVQWENSESGSCFLLLGPMAAQALRGIGAGFVEGEREGGELPDSGGQAFWLRIRETASAEFLLCVPDSQADALVDRLRSAVGAPALVGWDAFNVRRIESGSAWFGLDGDEARLVPEMLPEDRISYTKGCYLGQETIARLHYVGQLNWRIRRYRFAGEDLPAPGTELTDPEGARAGWTASATLHPAGGAVGLAFLHRRHWEAPESIRLPDGHEIDWITSAP